MKKHLICAAIACSALMNAAQAATITFNWQGNATRALSQYGIQIGDTVTGFVSFDPTAAIQGSTWNEGPGGTGGYIHWSGGAMSATINAGTLHESFSVKALVTNNYYGSMDGYEFYNGSSPIGNFSLQLQDATGTALSNRNLPTASPNLQAFATKKVSLNSQSFVNLTSFSTASTAVPEPATLGLFALGLAAVGVARRRKQRA